MLIFVCVNTLPDITDSSHTGAPWSPAVSLVSTVSLCDEYRLGPGDTCPYLHIHLANLSAYHPIHLRRSLISASPLRPSRLRFVPMTCLFLQLVSPPIGRSSSRLPHAARGGRLTITIKIIGVNEQTDVVGIRPFHFPSTASSFLPVYPCPVRAVTVRRFLYAGRR